MIVRFATEKDLPAVNVLRKQVDALHVAAKPEVFKPGFPDELRDVLFEAFQNPNYEIVVAEERGTLLGFAMLQAFYKPESPYRYAQSFLSIHEFGVDEAARRRGVGRALMEFNRALARGRGVSQLRLTVWEFNQEARSFYENVGFSAFQRSMEMLL